MECPYLKRGEIALCDVENGDGIGIGIFEPSLLLLMTYCRDVMHESCPFYMRMNGERGALLMD